MKPREIEKVIEKDGWKRVKSNGGSHRRYKHPVKTGCVTIPWHNKDLRIDTLNSILKQAQLK